MAVLEVRNVKKVFGDNVILRGIDLDVQKGDVIVILGPSGSGKTTFLRCLNLLEKPDEGSMVLNGRSTSFIASIRSCLFGLIAIP